ncbi:MAG: hypothetical protein WAP23_02100 [Candidatus Spechtbacterales bacterium]
MRGFTLIEFIVIIGIISLLSGLMLANYRGGQESLAARRSAQNIAQAIRTAQNLALAGDCSSARCRFGAHFDTSVATFIVFEDGRINMNGQYDAGEAIESIALEDNIIIIGLSSSYVCGLARCADVLFAPPDPALSFMPASATSLLISITGGRSITIEGVGSVDIN